MEYIYLLNFLWLIQPGLTGLERIISSNYYIDVFLLYYFNKMRCTILTTYMLLFQGRLEDITNIVQGAQSNTSFRNLCQSGTIRFLFSLA